MTILPKKKPAKDKSDPENSEHSSCSESRHNHPHSHSHSHSHYHHSTTSESRHEKGARGRTSPTRWLPPPREEKLPTHDPGGTFDSHDNSSSHNKRRHRSSPHRTARKHRNHATPAPLSPHSPSAGPSQQCEDGYNSGDEHCPPTVPDNIEELERWFEKALKEKKGFDIKKMGQDGACLFRAIADQVYGDQEMHTIVRKNCIDYMAKNPEFFSQYVTEDFKTYLNRKRMESCHGNNLEMQAMAELFNRPIEVYQYSIDPINTFHGAYKTDNEPMRVSYHGSVHYNSVIDPYKATIGVGLGLPGLQPGLAEKNLMRDAVKQSENFQLEKAMLEDKLRETDWELTQDTIEEQVARESYLQWLKEQEKQAKRQGSARSASATCSSSSDYTHTSFDGSGSPDARGGRSPRLRNGQSSGQNSPQRMEASDALATQATSQCGPTAGCSTSNTADVLSLVPDVADIPVGPQGATGGFEETASIMNHIAPYDWDEDEILAQVIAQSQHEYLDSLKKNAAVPMSSCEVSPTTSSSVDSNQINLYTANS
ncbi:OTU domain-containing protein 5-like [Gigantopelta aegis]|uniref:OTU domain-containing protein 5-like n=1 Tax=Gigantopelta aegis TaxID=1735272 RepID=UPI001B8882BB|nr:OTU domain-containing protein 5-like [Gigantopelta aegis]